MLFVGATKLETQLFDVVEHGELGAYFFIEMGIRSKPFDTPQLRNVHNDGPFLHNGAAATLHELWTRFNLYERHGRSHDLTPAKINDLVAYLETL